jgi:hypothetical protein
MSTKLCTKCNTAKPNTDFYFQKKRGYLSGYCKPCSKNCVIEYHKNNRKKHKLYSIKKKYGLNENEYNNFLKKYKNKCAVCLTNKTKLCVDHCHKSGKIRGILCTNCNVALGQVNDSIKILSKLINYLNEYKTYK